MPRTSIARALLAASWVGLCMAAALATERRLSFDRDVRPILANHCYACHGPDSAARKAGLRLDRADAAVEPHGGVTAIVPRAPERSEIVRRIRAADPDERMPPFAAKKPLTGAQVDLIERWIAEGAEYEPHWAFLAPVPALPPIVDGVDHPIDAFVRSRLAAEGLAPAAAADPATLLRRVTLGLTGLPPARDELDRFLDDAASGGSGAYERAVDRLLALPRYGEHQARFWLDAARYGDTHGLHLDNRREMWKYRDWVIDAFDRNLPFDQFAIEQLAGDLLPDPTLEQRVASGFNRCNVTTSEGGAIDEEYLVKYAIDRVETVSTVFLGLTLGCATCHDHKYDPFTQRDFYRLFAFFNNTAEAAMDGNAEAPAPVVRVPDEAEAARLDELARKSAAVSAELDTGDPSVDAGQRAWEAARRDALSGLFRTIEPATTWTKSGVRLGRLDDGSLLTIGSPPATDVHEVTFSLPPAGVAAIRLEALADPLLPSDGPGGGPDNGNFVLTEVEAALVAGDGRATEPLRFALATAEHSQPDYPIRETIDGDFGDDNGWAILKDGRADPQQALFTFDRVIAPAGDARMRLRFHFASRFAGHSIGRMRLSVASREAARASRLGPWSHAGPFAAGSGEEALARDFGPEGSTAAAASLPELPDGRVWTERPDFVDGPVHSFSNESYAAHFVARAIDAPEPRRMVVSLGSDDGVALFLNGVEVHRNEAPRPAAPDQDRVGLDLTAGTNLLLMKVVNYQGGCGFAFRVVEESLGGEPFDVAAILAETEAPRGEAASMRLRERYRREIWPRGRELVAERRELETARRELEASIPTTLVSQELAMRRPAHVLVRGQYDQKGDIVDPGVPDWLAPYPAAPYDRLGLARWLTHPDHPLTARVTVNRIWQQHFGIGIVKTSEDFGTQGSPPSHSELLDWLATWFVESGWDVKALHRLIVTSATYRQSSRADAAGLVRDPENRLLARGPRFRLDAEAIRDQALFVAGLLVERVGGPPVKPYQPDGIWEAVGYTTSNTATFVRDDGDALYRRSLYTFWKRTAPPPAMVAFDAPSRENCTVRRERTNTPLAALVLMNDEQFVEAARHLAARSCREGGPSIDERVAYAFRLVLARPPDATERSELRSLHDEQLARFAADAEGALALLAVGASPRDESLDAAEHAAMTLVASVILNLDEAVTKG